MKQSKIIYCDHAATTPLDSLVFAEMEPYFKEKFGNPSGVHAVSRKTAADLSRYRRKVADLLGADPKSITFTSGGSESDNLAIKGVAWKGRIEGRGNHIVSTKAEHPAVRTTLEHLSKIYGFETTLVDVNSEGRVDPLEVVKSIRKDTILVSVVAANNEVGSLQPVEEIATFVKRHRIPFHTDAVQAGRTIELPLESLKGGMVSFSGHKMYGPKGVGILYHHPDIDLLPQLTGGPQESGLRAGTENLPLIAGFAKAFELAQENREEEIQNMKKLRTMFLEGLRQIEPEAFVIGSKEFKLEHLISVVFPNQKADDLLMKLDLQGVCASSGSACSVGNPEPNRFVMDMGYDQKEALGMVRFSFGKSNDEAEIKRLLVILKNILRG